MKNKPRSVPKENENELIYSVCVALKRERCGAVLF